MRPSITPPHVIALHQIDIPSPCTAAWEAMQGSDQVRHCGLCKKSVFNLSAMPEAQAAALLAGNTDGSLCVRFYRRSDGTVMTSDCGDGRTVAPRARHRLAKLATAGAAMLAMAAHAAHAPPGNAQHAARHPARKAGAVPMVPATPVQQITVVGVRAAATMGPAPLRRQPDVPEEAAEASTKRAAHEENGGSQISSDA